MDWHITIKPRKKSEWNDYNGLVRFSKMTCIANRIVYIIFMQIEKGFNETYRKLEKKTTNFCMIQKKKMPRHKLVEMLSYIARQAKNNAV